MADKDFQKAYLLGSILWDYFKLNEELEEADFILVLGNFRLHSCAEKAAELFNKQMGNYIVVSGGVIRKITLEDGTKIKDTEANILKMHLMNMGVPEEKILLENKARTTGGNFLETEKLLNEKGLNDRSCIAVTMPFVERRARATVDKQTPKLKTQITSFDEDFDSFVGKQDKKEQIRLINVMVGTLNRIMDYPHLGHQTDQPVPKAVVAACDELIKMGYKGDYTRFSEVRKIFPKRFNKNTPKP